MLQRVLEPELMDDPDEAALYDQMDHTSVNQRFVENLLATGPICGQVLDVGTGTARIPILLCQSAEACQVMAADLAVSMLDVARLNVALSGLEYRIRLYHGDAKQLDCDGNVFDAVISNSLIHHIPQPLAACQQMVRVLRPGGRIFVRDLLRPDSAEQIEHLVRLHTPMEPESSQQLFRQSLAAALSLPEIQEIVTQLGFSPDSVTATSDRHWTWTGIKP